MNQDILQFFDTHPNALPLYELFEQRLLSEIDDELMGWVKEAAVFSVGKRR